MATKAPKVQTLAQSMAALDSGYSEQRGLINEQIQGLGAASEVRRQRLEGAKVNNFNAINDSAVGRGAAFSGIPIHEQADYLSDVFLPGMQEIESIESSERMQLRSTLAQLNTQQNTAALSRIDQQQQALNQWNLTQAQIEAQARENALNRKFTTSERIASQKFTAGQNAANRAASSAGSSASSQLSPAQAVAQAMAAAGTRTNSKGKIVSAANSAESTAAQLSAAGYGSYNDLLKKAYAWRTSTYGEK